MEKKTKKKIVKKVEEKKDLKPIILYFIATLAIPILIGIVYLILLGLSGTPISDSNFENIIVIASLVAEIILALIFLILYGKRIAKDLKKLKGKDFLTILLLTAVILGFSYVLTALFEYFDVEMSNQDQIVELFGAHRILTTVAVAICAPILEELVFRYSFSTFLKDDTTFLVVSSVIFGACHGIGIATILYILIGVILGKVYLKYNKNVVAPMIIHIINNTISVIELFLAV